MKRHLRLGGQITRLILLTGSIVFTAIATSGMLAQTGQLKAGHAAAAETSSGTVRSGAGSGHVDPNTIYLKLVVNDLDRSSAFYRAVFGLQEMLRLRSTMEHRPMGEVMFRFADGATVPLVLIHYLDGRPVPARGQSVVVFFTDDLDKLVARVRENGGRLTEVREEPGHKARVAFWRDPEDNEVETVEME